MSQCNGTNRGYIPCFGQKVGELVKMALGLESLPPQDIEVIRKIAVEGEVTREEAVREANSDTVDICDEQKSGRDYHPSSGSLATGPKGPRTVYSLCLPSRLFDQVIKGKKGRMLSPENIDVVLSKTREVIGKNCGK